MHAGSGRQHSHVASLDGGLQYSVYLHRAVRAIDGSIYLGAVFVRPSHYGGQPSEDCPASPSYWCFTSGFQPGAISIAYNETSDFVFIIKLHNFQIRRSYKCYLP